MKKPINNTSQNNNQRTREAIMTKSLELINANGMMDFRIDSLATALNLSPGNITYHFSRKEDICSALWEAYLLEFSQVKNSLTSLLDVKQLYLMNRINLLLAYKYRGVLIFRSADFGAICRDCDSNQQNLKFHYDTSIEIYSLLAQNGYMKPDAGNPDVCSIAISNNYLALRWAINLEYQSHTESEIEHEMEKAALLGLHTIYPLLSEKGRKEFKDIAEIVNNNQLSSRYKINGE